MNPLSGWDNFYVIIGSSAGALIGLQFVVITLIADTPAANSPQANTAFSTPTIVHFGAVLLLSAIVNAPWQGVKAAAVAWGLVGLFGVVYEIVVARRMQSQTAYRPVFEDWLCHAVLPFLAYATLAASALIAPLHAYAALLAVAAAVLVLLFVSIHNAWDAVTYHVFFSRRKRREAEPPGQT